MDTRCVSNLQQKWLEFTEWFADKHWTHTVNAQPFQVGAAMIFNLPDPLASFLILSSSWYPWRFMETMILCSESHWSIFCLEEDVHYRLPNTNLQIWIKKQSYFHVTACDLHPSPFTLQLGGYPSCKPSDPVESVNEGGHTAMRQGTVLKHAQGHRNMSNS